MESSPALDLGKEKVASGSKNNATMSEKKLKIRETRRFLY